MKPEELKHLYAEEYSSPESEQLRRIHRDTYLHTAYPNMLSGPVLGNLLRLISSMIQPSKVVEIGTFTGYSALCLAEGLRENGVLHTIERNPEMESMIRTNLDSQLTSGSIRLHLGDALEIIPGLGGNIDLAFIDGEKQEYIDYYEALLPQMKEGGIILADNVLWGGKVLDPDTTDKDTDGIRAFNRHVQEDTRTENVLLTVRDGLSVIRVLSSEF